MQVAFAGLGMLVLPPLAGVIAAQTSFESIPLFILALTLMLAVVALLALRLKVASPTTPDAAGQP